MVATPHKVARKQLSFVSWSSRLTGNPPGFCAEAPRHVAPFWVERSAMDLSKRLCDKELLRSFEKLGHSGGFWAGIPAGESIGDRVSD